MFIATVAVGALLTLAFLGAGGAKLAGVDVMRESASHLSFSFGSYRAIGVLEVLGALGVAFSLWAVHPFGPRFGALAATGLLLLMVGAVFAHRRAGDTPGLWAPPLALALVSGLFIALRLATA